jgi:hypothetical protein
VGEAEDRVAVSTRVAQTNIQLYNELRASGRALDELICVHRAYELLTALYPGYYQADGKPFVAHGVGVASVLAQLGQPAEIVAVGLLHNVYGNADFGDRHGPGATPARRREVRAAVGERLEALVAGFAELRKRAPTAEEALCLLPGLGAVERSLLLVELADQLEKHVDQGVLYFGHSDWVAGTAQRPGGDLFELADALGQPQLAEMLREAFARTAEEASLVPAELRPSDGRRYLTLVVPRSCRRRLVFRVSDLWVALRARARLRTRLRSVVRS